MYVSRLSAPAVEGLIYLLYTHVQQQRHYRHQIAMHDAPTNERQSWESERKAIAWAEEVLAQEARPELLPRHTRAQVAFMLPDHPAALPKEPAHADA